MPDYVTEYPSPSGRYVVRTVAHEMKMSHWVHTPAVFESDAEEPFVQLGSLWSADRVEWPRDDTVVMKVREYPGGSGFRTLGIDCATRTFVVDGSAPQSLSALGDAL